MYYPPIFIKKTPLTLVFIKNKYNICGGKLIKSIT